MKSQVVVLTLSQVVGDMWPQLLYFPLWAQYCRGSYVSRPKALTSYCLYVTAFYAFPGISGAKTTQHRTGLLDVESQAAAEERFGNFDFLGTSTGELFGYVMCISAAKGSKLASKPPQLAESCSPRSVAFATAACFASLLQCRCRVRRPRQSPSPVQR